MGELMVPGEQGLTLAVQCGFEPPAARWPSAPRPVASVGLDGACSLDVSL